MAPPGERFVYHVGDLAFDRGKKCRKDAVEGSFDVMARRMWSLYERGLVLLTRRRVDAGAFEYIAIRKRLRRP